MIHRTDFIRRCLAEGLTHSLYDPATMWRAPIYYTLWWVDDEVLLMKNDPEHLKLGRRRAEAVYVFREAGDLELAIQTYNLLHP